MGNTVLIIVQLFVLESLLSVDNATALAAMVKHLPEKQQKRALRYGLAGAYAFRFGCLFAASYLLRYQWLKIAGGLYLIKLTYKFFKNRSADETDIEGMAKGFWATVIAVEVLDFCLSIDNIFAAVALTDSIVLIMIGVGIGILSMRFIAFKFVKLIQLYPSLEGSAFIVIAILGIKLILSGCVHYMPSMAGVGKMLDAHWFDFAFTGVMLVVFLFPIIFKRSEIVIVDNTDNSFVPISQKMKEQIEGRIHRKGQNDDVKITDI